jgi:hypothetical protein
MPSLLAESKMIPTMALARVSPVRSLSAITSAAPAASKSLAFSSWWLMAA